MLEWDAALLARVIVRVAVFRALADVVARLLAPLANVALRQVLMVIAAVLVVTLGVMVRRVLRALSIEVRVPMVIRMVSASVGTRLTAFVAVPPVSETSAVPHSVRCLRCRRSENGRVLESGILVDSVVL